jgi:hypothetical protein
LFSHVVDQQCADDGVCMPIPRRRSTHHSVCVNGYIVDGEGELDRKRMSVVATFGSSIEVRMRQVDQGHAWVTAIVCRRRDVRGIVGRPRQESNL